MYGPPMWNEKDLFQYELAELENIFKGPWAVMGDFNAILSQTEKQGGRLYASSSSSDFPNFIFHTGTVDIRCWGNPFTWANARFGQAFIQERLDQVIANGEWQFPFPRVNLRNSPRCSSDHAMLLLNTDGEQGSGPHPFKFESWAWDPTGQQVVKRVQLLCKWLLCEFV